MSGENRTILLTLMGLEIGGAETHVVELAKALKSEGYNILVASNGGCYEKELSDSGIKHYQVPLHNKLVHNVLKSFFRLENIITSEKVDLIHAHARIPAFICEKLARKHHIPFVTTAHWVFDTHWGLKYLTTWGERTIAVSEDIKKYLIDNYNISPNKITVTINGIDTYKFSPNVSPDDIIKEFQLTPSSRKIVYTGRLSRDRAESALLLVKAVPELLEVDPNLEFIIVGDGNMYEEISKAAEEINHLVGNRKVIMTGARTDINHILAVADIYVGVSRAALEAMATTRPVVLAGNEGYLGIFSEANRQSAMTSNFTCRGEPPVTMDKLIHDITVLLHSDRSYLEHLGNFGRETVEKYYSVKRMASDCLKVYEEVWKEREGARL